jgi:hypothetical protein
MIGSAVVSQVSRKVATEGGTVSAISLMRDSEMGPGPLGIRDTRPIADAPISTARAASSSDAMQQILTLGRTDSMYGNCIQLVFGPRAFSGSRHFNHVTREAIC